MTIKKLMMGAGAIDEPQVIAPSSNDWDYTFSNNLWPCAGNTLGDGTVGGTTSNAPGDTGLSSLITLEGDFRFDFKGTDLGAFNGGVHAIDEDDTRAQSGRMAMESMTNSFFYRNALGQVRIGADSDGSLTITDGHTVSFVRVDGTITIEDNGSTVHTFSDTYSGVMRAGFGGGGITPDVDMDDMFFTDTDKIQRDGNWNEGNASTNANGDANGYREAGFRFPSTRSGTVSTVSFYITAVGNSYTSHVEIWSDDGLSPVAQIGSDSNTINLTGAGTKTYTLTDVTLEKSKYYWAICFDNEADGSGDASFQKVDEQNHLGSGRHDTPTSITDNLTGHWKCEIVVDTSDKEPSPGHNTLLLLHSNASDSSTSFTDSSPSGRTPTVVGNTQHDTAQKKFGTSAILFDGTGDYLTFPDSTAWNFGLAYTIDFWFRLNSVSGNMAVIEHGTSKSYSGINILIQYKSSGSKLECFMGNGGSSGTSVESSSLSISTWYHIAVVKNHGRLFVAVDGTITGDATGNMAFNDRAATLKIGEDTNFSEFNGWMDEIRISNVARWDANFTPPSAPYP